MKDSRLSGVTVNRLSLQGATVSNTRLDGCIVTDTQIIESEISDCAFRGASLLDSEIGASRLKDSRFEAIGFAHLRVQNSELRNVTFRDSFDGRIPRRAENLVLLDVKLDNVQFIGCTFRNTTIKGIKADGLRLRGADLSDRTIESAEDLARLSDR
jgi:uncharacterized protein YjbI with pentapeptide repeats